MRTAVVIQAGGRSRRMGRDKGLAELAGTPLIAHVLARVQGLTDGVIITTNQPAAYRLLGQPLAQDLVPGAGALPGLRTALSAAVEADHVLVVGCDMPFLQRPLLAHLLDLAPTADVIVPRWDSVLQPLCAVYRREPALAAVDAALSKGRRAMRSIHDALDVRIVEPDEVMRFDATGRSFFNVNTPDDLLAAAAFLADNP